MSRTFNTISAALLASSALAGSAYAQSAPPAPVDESATEEAVDDGTELVVTGTRATGQMAAQSATPIQVLNEEALTHVGQPNLNQALTQIVPSFQAQTQGTDMASFSLSARLRGVSPNHTLLMVNGKRRHGNSILQVINGAFGGSAAPSLDLIPPDIVKRIEVLQDGAAAQYGSDAIAGVINIILKSDTSGGTIKATAGKYFDGEGLTKSVSGVIGIPLGDSGFLDISLFHRKNDFTTVGTSQTSVSNLDGSTVTNVSAAFAPIYDALNKSGYLSNLTGGQPKSLLNVAFFNAGYDFGGVELYAFGDVSYRDGSAKQGYRPPNRVCPVVGATPANCFQPTVLQGMVPQQQVKQNEYSVTAGLRGDFSDWNWDLSTTYAHDKADIFTNNSANISLFRATGFTPREFYNGAFEFNQSTTTLDIRKEFNVGFADPMTFAFGGEYRHETYAIFAGDSASTFVEGGQSFPGYTASDATKKKRTAKAIYADVVVKPADGLLLEVAGRYEHYSDFGSTKIGKITGRYDFSPVFALRATASTGFRAPSMPEISYTATNVGPTNATVQLAPGSPGALAAGFGALKPERSTNFSAGIVFRPIPRLVMTLDGYIIKVKDRIVSSGAITGQRNGAAVTTPLINGLTPSALVTGAIAAAGKSIDPGVLATGTLAIQTFTNGIDTSTKGVELSVRYPLELGFGELDLSLGMNYNVTNVVTSRLGTLFNAQAEAIIETASPKVKTVFGALFNSGGFGANLRANYYSATTALVSPAITVPSAPIPGNFFPVQVKPSVIVDLEFDYDVTPWANVAIGANNLFNKTPPIPALVTDFSPTTVIASGTSPYVNGQTGINAPYGFGPYGTNGGYYYARLTFKF